LAASPRIARIFWRSGEIVASAGIRPSTGSTMSDVRLSAVIFRRRASIQCSLYARLTSAALPPSRRSRDSSFASDDWNSSASSSLSTPFSPILAGRCSGVLVASFHTP
jgi:hypothetical protein